MKKCRNCSKDFRPARNRKETVYCSINCYQDSRVKKYKFDWGQFIWDGACIMAPILILAFAFYCITPKEDMVSIRENLKKEIQEREASASCCDETMFCDDEDDKFYNHIIKGRN